jgi:hypothetical protein
MKVMVCDEKLLLKNPDVFQLLADRKYPLVVPQSGKRSRTRFLLVYLIL